MSNTVWHSTSRRVFGRIRRSALERFHRRMVAVCVIVPVAGLILALGVQLAFAGDGAAGGPEPASAPISTHVGATAVISAAGVMAAALIATGYAVGRVGSAAMGAASERPELMVRSLVFVALAEGIAVWGLIVAVLLLGKV